MSVIFDRSSGANANDPQTGSKLDQYQFEIVIGKGAFGTVYRCLAGPTDRIVAIKEMTAKQRKGLACQSGLREVLTLRSLFHPNVVQLTDCFSERNNLYLVMEYCSHNLATFLRGRQILSLSTRKGLLRQLLRGVAYCHANLVIHRDLKPDNIGITASGQVKLLDFGLAKCISYDCQKHSPEVITIMYRDIDILLENDRYGTEVDIWSVGCIAVEILGRDTPFFMPTYSDIKRHQIKQQIACIFLCLGGPPTEENWPGITSRPAYQNICATLSTNLNRDAYLKPKPTAWVVGWLREDLGTIDISGIELILGLLRYNPANRLTAFEALNSSFLSNPDPDQ